MSSNLIDGLGNSHELGASDNFKLTTLYAAVQAAGLTDVLSGAGPLTVFAPTNTAFDKVRHSDKYDLCSVGCALCRFFIFIGKV